MPGTPHDRRNIVALVTRRPPKVNVTMPFGEIAASRRGRGGHIAG